MECSMTLFEHTEVVVGCAIIIALVVLIYKEL